MELKINQVDKEYMRREKLRDIYKMPKASLKEL
jgi:hypothetical protein